MNATQLRRMAARIPKHIERKELETSEQKLELEIKAIKTQIIDAIKAKADLATVTAMQTQLDALDAKIAEKHTGGGGGNQKSLVDILNESEDFKRLVRDRKGTAILNLKGADIALLERKTTIDSAAVGVQTTGVLQIDRMTGITREARQTLRLRNLLISRPTSLQVIDFVRVNSPMAIASPQSESSAKAENAVSFTSESEKVQTIAHWVPASKQVLDDMAELAAFINDSLLYYTNLSEELQMLSGAGTGTDLNGLITQATAFQTALLTGSWTRIDVIGAAVQQLNVAKEVDPTFVVVNPTDWWAIRRTKDSQGRYLLGDPATIGSPRLWDLDVVPTNNIAVGTFLVGSGNPEATVIRDRMEAQVEVATQHSDYFTKNLVAVRCEKRVALVTRRPASFVKGNFTTSPA